jgi:DNA topoisomerase-2
LKEKEKIINSCAIPNNHDITEYFCNNRKIQKFSSERFPTATKFFEEIGVLNWFEKDNKKSYGVDRSITSLPTMDLKIIDIRPAGIEKVYDIEVYKTHNFQVNGILVHNCVTEGDSANTYAVAGMKYGLKFNGKEVKGRDYIGSLPIRGKFLNVRNASIQSLLKNSEVKSLIQALGLQYDVDYSNDENYKKLRYGRLMALTDADNDGSHIKGLIINFIHAFWPSLIKFDSFVSCIITPIVKVSHGKEVKSFYNQQEE